MARYKLSPSSKKRIAQDMHIVLLWRTLENSKFNYIIIGILLFLLFLLLIFLIILRIRKKNNYI
jgi:hypothetical protein